MVTKCANVYYIYDQTDTRVARCRPYGFARRGKGSGTAQQAAPNDESWRKYEGHFNGHKIHECILYYDQSDLRVAQRVRPKRQDERNSTSSQRRR